MRFRVILTICGLDGLFITLRLKPPRLRILLNMRRLAGAGGGAAWPAGGAGVALGSAAATQ